jgi:DNA-binding transcriptional regulator GbsR (MarR family)
MDDSSLDRDSLALNPELLQFIENIGMYYEGYGIPRIGARMFGLFLITAVPLSAEQIAQALKASRGSVSLNVRALLANGWIEKVTFPGDRTEYYRFSPSAWEKVMERRKQSFAPLKRMAAQAKAALPSEHPARGQVEAMAEWADMLSAHYENLIAAWQAHVAERQSTK